MQNFKIPGWLIRMGGRIAVGQVEGDENRIAVGLLKKMGTTQILYSEKGVKIPAKDILRLREDLLQGGFEELIAVRDGYTNLQVMADESDDVVRHLFVLYHDNESGEMAFISAKTNLKLNELGSLLSNTTKGKKSLRMKNKQENKTSQDAILTDD